MTARNTITTDTLKFERLLDAPIEKVWQYLVDPDLRARWFMGGPIDERVGGDITLTMNDKTLSDDDVPVPERFGPVIGQSWVERITAIEPPHLLSFTWDEGKAGEVTIKLNAEAGQTRLVLTHTGLRGRDDALDYGGGWHAHLSLLELRISGNVVSNFWTLLDESEHQVRLWLGD